MSQPINGTDDTDDDHLADGPCAGVEMECMLRAIPSQCQRQHCAQNCHRAQQIDGPEPAAIAMPVMQCPLVILTVFRPDRFDQRLEALRRLRGQ